MQSVMSRINSSWFVLWSLVIPAALRIPLAVTWLTVYRQLQIVYARSKFMNVWCQYFFSRGTITFSHVYQRPWDGKYESTHTIPRNPILFPFKSNKKNKSLIQPKGRVPYIITSQRWAQSHLYRYDVQPAVT